MNILLIHRYFWPDTPPYAAMLRMIARRLVEDGHQVTVFSSQPSYKRSVQIPRQPSCEILDGFTVRRFSLFPESKSNLVVRALNVPLFMAGILWHVLSSKKYQVIMISTMPPVMAGLIGRIAAKITGASFIYHCMDIHPEAGRVAGFFKDGLFYRWLRKIDLNNCNKAHAVVVLSEDMGRTLRQREGQRGNNIRIINNFNLPDFDVSQKLGAEHLKKENVFRILFAGNLGHYQGLETVIDAAKSLKEFEDIEFIFLGDGAAKEDLRKRADGLVDQSVYFFPHQSVAVAKQFIKNSDLGLVTLVPDIYKVAYPSKTMTYLSQGCPLLVMVEPESELSRFVVKEKIGYVTPCGDVQAMREVIIDAYRQRDGQKELSDRAKSLGEKMYDIGIAMETWSSFFNDIKDGKK